MAIWNLRETYVTIYLTLCLLLAQVTEHQWPSLGHDFVRTWHLDGSNDDFYYNNGMDK